MPLEQRVIKPICVSRNCVPLNYSISNELEFVTNNTLANIIRQLSSLSKYAEDLFGAILNDSIAIVNRTNNLQLKINKMVNKVMSLDSSIEEVSLQVRYNQKLVLFSSALPSVLFVHYGIWDCRWSGS